MAKNVVVQRRTFFKNLYLILFLNLRELRVSRLTPKIKRTKTWGQRTSSPLPFRKIPLTITRKYRRGMR
jgi:hypothetical protein